MTRRHHSIADVNEELTCVKQCICVSAAAVFSSKYRPLSSTYNRVTVLNTRRRRYSIHTTRDALYKYTSSVYNDHRHHSVGDDEGRRRQEERLKPLELIVPNNNDDDNLRRVSSIIDIVK